MEQNRSEQRAWDDDKANEKAQALKSFKQLRIWQKGVEIVKDVYAISKPLPPEERGGLTRLLKESSISVPSHIAEGFRRYDQGKDYKQFLNAALGALAALETQLVIARDLGFIDGKNLPDISGKIEYESKMIGAFLKKIKVERRK